MSRREAVDESAASRRLEGLNSGPEVDDLLERWARGEVQDDALEGFVQNLLRSRAKSD